MGKENIESLSTIERLLLGIKKVSNAVAPTYGPYGRNVVLEKTNHQGEIIVVNDGLTIAKEIVLADKFENQGAKLLTEVAIQTNRKVGDGTTTAMLLASAMVEQGILYLVAGANPMRMKIGIDKAVDAVVAYLEEHAKMINTSSDLRNIASIAAKSEEIGDMLGDMLDVISSRGFITIETSKTMKTEAKVVEGMRLTSGYLSRYMCNDKIGKMVHYEEPYLLISKEPIVSVQKIKGILETIRQSKQKLVVIAPDIQGDALTTIVLNRVKGLLDVAAIRALGIGMLQEDLLDDIAVFSGGMCIKKELGMLTEEMSMDMLGRAKSITIDANSTVILGGYGEKEQIEQRVEEIKSRILRTQSQLDCEHYHERISKLTNGIGVISVGGVTEVEMIEQKLLIEDAILATKAAVDEGVLPGGGAAYIHAAVSLSELIQTLDKDERLGASLVQYGLYRPLRQLAWNGGCNASQVVEQVKSKDFSYGWDARNECICELMNEGILDTVKACKIAVKNACSLTSMVLTAQAVCSTTKDLGMTSEQLLV